MAKIKGWKKVQDLQYPLNPDVGEKEKWIRERGVIKDRVIIKNPSGYDEMMHDFRLHVEVWSGVEYDVGDNIKRHRRFKTHKAALKWAIEFMKKHPLNTRIE